MASDGGHLGETETKGTPVKQDNILHLSRADVEAAGMTMRGIFEARDASDSINPGLALDDLATAVLLCRRAKEMGIGRELPL